MPYFKSIVNGYSIEPNADLSDADLRGANLRNADLEGADLSDADLTDADLRGANLRNADLEGADLEGADLTSAVLLFADLTGADLYGAKLSWAYLQYAHLEDADLRSAMFRESDLEGADLRGADLRNADFEGADLRDANLTDAVLHDPFSHGNLFEVIVDNNSNRHRLYSITGPLKVDQELTLTIDKKDPDGFNTNFIPSYQWKSSSDNGLSWINIENSTSSTYTPSTADIGNLIRVNITYRDGEGFWNNTSARTNVVIENKSPISIWGNIDGIVLEDVGAITGTLSASSIDGLTDGSYFTVSTAATNGTATIDNESGAWSYTPNANYNGSDQFTVTVTDDAGATKTQEVSLTITNENDPILIGGNIDGIVLEDVGAITGTLLASSIDGLTDGSYFTVSTAATNGTATIDNESGAWSYTPNANYNGSDQFTVTVTDDAGGTTTQVVSLTVNAVDDAETIGGDITGSGDEDGSAITGTLTAVDAADGFTDGSYFTVSSQATNGIAIVDTSTGEWSYAPIANYNGRDVFAITITDDDNHTTTQVVSLTVNPVNDAATIGGDITGSGDEDGTAITGTISATDIDGLTDPFVRHFPESVLLLRMVLLRLIMRVEHGPILPMRTTTVPIYLLLLSLMMKGELQHKMSRSPLQK